MLKVETLVFNDFQINTYIISGENNDCFIIDPGCYYDHEKLKLKNFIFEKKYKPVSVINTHGHVDHLLGNKFVKNEYNLEITGNKYDIPLYKNARLQALMYGFEVDDIPEIDKFINEPDELILGEEIIKILFVPGHSPGSIALYNEKAKFVIVGDVLFYNSIGRTDLFGGDYQLLINSIKTKLLSRNDDVVVYPGHGPVTTIGHERRANPFLK